jgi:transmembrane sensor
MKHNYKHSELNSDPGQLPEGFFQGVEIPYKKTREEVWAELDKQLNETPSPVISVFKSYRLTIGIAAAILLLGGVFSLLRFYTNTAYCPEGQHMSYLLPDGSSVELNADSKLTFKPLWWRFDRQLSFEGEGFFDVKKGKKFEVVSKIGRTEVLGTSFNIYSRGDEYNVTCITGQVRVVSLTSEEAVLNPEYEARIDKGGNIVVTKEIKAGTSHAWINNMFNFTSRPLDLVLNEIERQYGVHIISNITPDYSYTGYFSKNRPVEEVLTLICKPFGLTFARISEKEYKIIQN